MLDAGVVDQDVDPPELGRRKGHHVLDLGGFAHVGAVVAHLHAHGRGHFGLRALWYRQSR
jgi:hypothetical protein